MKNKKLAIAAINQGCQLEGETIGPKGQTCAIGALALAAGMTRKCIRKYTEDGTEFIGELSELQDAIEAKFALSIDYQQKLQAINDADHKSTPARRRALIEAVKQL